MWNKPGVRFILVFLVSYSVLTGLTTIPGINKVVHSVYRSISKSALNITLPNLEFNTKAQKVKRKTEDNTMVVEFEWPQSKIDEVIAEARRTGRTDVEVPYRFITYELFEFFSVPLIFILALIIATPMAGPKSKWTKGLLAYLALWAFLLIKFILFTVFSVSKAKIDVYELGDGPMSTLHWLATVMTMGVSVILALVLWLAIMFPHSKLKDGLLEWFDDRLGG